MNVNYILVALAVLTIACIYLFWLTFKQSQEILALSSRVNNSDVLDGGGGEKNNKVITEVIKKVGEIDNNLNEVNKYIFGNLIPRLEGRHSTNDDVQAEEDEEVEDDNLTETDLENIERLGEDLENDADEENNVMLDDDEENNDDTELNSGNNSDTLDLEIDDMPTLDLKQSKMSNVNIDIHNLDDISINADDVDFSDLDVDDSTLSLENLKNKSLKELRTIAQDSGLKIKGNKNELINSIINT
jgi:hypothetical protein